jgi:hypothetical protein
MSVWTISQSAMYIIIVGCLHKRPYYVGEAPGSWLGASWYPLDEKIRLRVVHLAPVIVWVNSSYDEVAMTNAFDLGINPAD